MDPQTANRISEDPRFIELQKTRDRFAWTLAIIMLVIYYGFIFMVAFLPDVMGMTFAGAVTLGFPIGLGVILSAIILTGIYVQRANGEFDRMTADIVASNERHSAGAARTTSGVVAGDGRRSMGVAR